MATPTLVSTPAGASSNSYATVSEADAYHDSRLFRDAWAATGSDADTKTVALIMATRTIDAMFEWAASPTTTTQALQWPLNSVMRRGGLVAVGSMEIPPELKNATAELARLLIVSDRTADNDVERNKLRALTAGPVSLQFDPGVVAQPIADLVAALLPPEWGFVRSRDAAMREVVRG
jgi:hypothetical protein